MSHHFDPADILPEDLTGTLNLSGIADGNTLEWDATTEKFVAAPGGAYTPGGTDVAIADGGTGASTAADARTNLGAVGLTGNETIAGTKTFSSDVVVPDEAYDATAWDGSLEVPTKNAVRDKIETLVGGSVSDAAYGVGWDGDTTTAPSKNAVYDKIETLGGGSVSDTAYAGSWDGVTTVAPSKNAVYDKIETLFPHRAKITAIEQPFSGQYTTWTLTLDNPIVDTAATAAQNDEGVWLVDLAAGTWTLALHHYMRNVRPIYTFALSTDGSSYTDIGTIDGYSSVTSGAGTAARSTITGITVATSGRYYLRAKHATRNASATGWVGAFSEISLTRTGA